MSDLDTDVCVQCGSELMVPVVINGIPVTRLCTWHAREVEEDIERFRTRYHALLAAKSDS